MLICGSHGAQNSNHLVGLQQRAIWGKNGYPLILSIYVACFKIYKRLVFLVSGLPQEPTQSRYSRVAFSRRPCMAISIWLSLYCEPFFFKIWRVYSNLQAFLCAAMYSTILHMLNFYASSFVIILPQQMETLVWRRETTQPHYTLMVKQIHLNCHLLLKESA